MLLKKVQPLFSHANRVRVGYTVAFLLLLFSLGLTAFSVQKFLYRARAGDRTTEVITNLGNLMGVIKDAETGFRGYLIIKDAQFLEPYNGSRKSADSLLLLVKQQLADNLVQIKHAHVVDELISKRFKILETGLLMFSLNNNQIDDPLKSLLYDGKIVMDSIRQSIKMMQQDEKGLMMRLNAEMGASSAAIQTINIASLLVSILLAFYSFIFFNKENKAREIANDKTADYRKRLEERVVELRNANAELVTLRRSEKFAATGRIARTIAHEVRNPLTNVNLAIEQLKEDIPLHKDDQHSLLEMVIRNSSRINQLVTDLLHSTRFAELKYASKSINHLVDEALEMANDRIKLNRITVVKKYSDDMCNVEVDVEKVTIAFLNIIVNAIEAMEAGKGTLTIRTTGEGGECVTYISDNGVGMDEEALQKLFEPYFTSKTSGNGLGMTNTQNIILNHNGTINVESTPGNGTTFIIALKFPQQQAVQPFEV